MAMDPKTVENIKLTLNQVKEILDPVIEITDQIRQIVSNLLDPVIKFLTIKSDFFDSKENMLSGINSNYKMVNVVPIRKFDPQMFLSFGAFVGSALVNKGLLMLKK